MAEIYQLAALETDRAAGKRSYLEFLRSQSMSMGLYVLRAGEADGQQPHAEEEAYYVIRGRARFRAGDEDWEVSAGSTLFVEAGLDHRFHDVEEDLSVLVFFAPPEGSA